MVCVYVVHEINVLQFPLTDAGGVTATHRLRCWMHLRVSGLADSDYDRERRWRSECGATCTLRRELAPPALHSRICGSGLTLGITIDLCIVLWQSEQKIYLPIRLIPRLGTSFKSIFVCGEWFITARSSTLYWLGYPIVYSWLIICDKQN